MQMLSFTNYKLQFMKKLLSVLFTVFIFSIFLLFSCKPQVSDDYDKIVNDIAIKPEFAKSSPVADHITLQFLDKPNQRGNFRMTANLRGQLTDQYLAYEVDDQKIVMRDDGKGADSLQGDGIYSVYINIDTSEVREIINQQNMAIGRANQIESNQRDMTSLLKLDRKDTSRTVAFRTLLLNDPNFTFENRHVRFEKKNVSAFDFESVFKLRRPIDIFPRFLCPPPPADLIPKSLMITDLSVVEDPTRTWNSAAGTGNKTGAWTFNNIINHMVNKSATGKTATEFILTWLKTWGNNIPLNGDNAGARGSILALINNWQQRSIANGLPNDTLDMAEAPVKLLAIVNRVDLRQNTGYSSSNAGEGRFVFAVMNSSNTSISTSPLPFTIIFEYGINRKSCKAVQSWGQEWYDLHTKAFGDPAYNKALQKITDQFVNANADPTKPNGSSLNQIRTNEIALSIPWQLREFNIDAGTHLLKLVTVKKTPRDNLNGTAAIADFINAHCAAILANNYDVHDVEGGQPFLGAKSEINGPVWNAPGITCADVDNTRHIFSLNTCNACHGGETSTAFTHVNTAPFGTEATLSGFLNGVTVTDPVSGTLRTFADLPDRAIKLQQLVCMSCKKFFPLVFKANVMTH